MVRHLLCSALIASSLLTTALAGSNTGSGDGYQDLPKTEWRATLRKSANLGRGLYQFGAPMLRDDTLYVGSAKGGLFAIATTGKSRWHYDTTGPVFAPVAVYGNLVYAADAEGTVYAVHRDDGREEWRLELDAEIMAQPLATEATLFVVTMRGELIAIHRDSGAVRWRTPGRLVATSFSVKGASDPVAVGELIVVGHADGRVTAYRQSNGDIAWEERVAGRNAVLQDVDTKPLVVDGRLYIAAAGRGLMALEPSTGKTLWRSKLGSPNNLLLANNILYVAGQGNVYAVDPKTGGRHWESQLPESEVAAPVLVNGKLITISTQDRLYVLDPATGQLLGKRHLGSGTYGDLAVDGNLVYVLTNAANLLALRVP